MSHEFMKPLLVRLIVAVAMCATVGCNQYTPPTTTQGEPLTFIQPLMTDTPNRNWIPGVDSTTLFGGTSDGKTAFLIWTDVVYSDSFVSTAGGPGEYSGYLLAPGADRIDWKCTANTGGKQGTMILGGKSYDLTNGSLFLVVRISGKTSVKQVQQDLSMIGNGKDGFDQWCRSGGFKKWFDSISEINEFFSQSDDAR